MAWWWKFPRVFLHFPLPSFHAFAVIDVVKLSWAFMMTQKFIFIPDWNWVNYDLDVSINFLSKLIFFCSNKFFPFHENYVRMNDYWFGCLRQYSKEKRKKSVAWRLFPTLPHHPLDGTFKMRMIKLLSLCSDPASRLFAFMHFIMIRDWAHFCVFHVTHLIIIPNCTHYFNIRTYLILIISFFIHALLHRSYDTFVSHRLP